MASFNNPPSAIGGTGSFVAIPQGGRIARQSNAALGIVPEDQAMGNSQITRPDPPKTPELEAQNPLDQVTGGLTTRLSQRERTVDVEVGPIPMPSLKENQTQEEPAKKERRKAPKKDAIEASVERAMKAIREQIRAKEKVLKVIAAGIDQVIEGLKGQEKEYGKTVRAAISVAMASTIGLGGEEVLLNNEHAQPNSLAQ